MGWNVNDADDKNKDFAIVIDKHLKLLSGNDTQIDGNYMVMPISMQYIYDRVIEYLNDCNKALDEVIKNEKKDVLKNIKEVYRNISIKLNDGNADSYYNIDEVMNLINEQIQLFKKNLNKKLSE